MKRDLQPWNDTYISAKKPTSMKRDLHLWNQNHICEMRPITTPTAIAVVVSGRTCLSRRSSRTCLKSSRSSRTCLPPDCAQSHVSFKSFKSHLSFTWSCQIARIFQVVQIARVFHWHLSRVSLVAFSPSLAHIWNCVVKNKSFKSHVSFTRTCVAYTSHFVFHPHMSEVASCKRSRTCLLEDKRPTSMHSDLSMDLGRLFSVAYTSHFVFHPHMSGVVSWKTSGTLSSVRPIALVTLTLVKSRLSFKTQFLCFIFLHHENSAFLLKEPYILSKRPVSYEKSPMLYRKGPTFRHTWYCLRSLWELI